MSDPERNESANTAAGGDGFFAKLTPVVHEAAALLARVRHYVGDARTRVVLADELPAFRDGVRNALEARGDMRVVGEASSAQEALLQAMIYEPDVLVADLRLPDMSAADLTKQILARPENRTAVVVLSTAHDQIAAHALLQAGVSAFVSKRLTASEIARRVGCAAAGETVSESDADAVASGPLRGLSSREAEVLALLCAGARNHDIATRLVVSVKTVEFHVKRLFRKLRVRSRAQAVARAHALGLA